MHKQNWKENNSYNLTYNLDEAALYFMTIGLILLATFSNLIFFNNYTIPTYISGAWSIILISYKYWPALIKKFAQSIFYFLILASNVVIFNCIILDNFTWNWAYISSLVCFFVLASFLNWIVFLGMTLLSFSISLFITHFIYQDYTLNLISDNIELLVNSTIPLLCIIIIWRHKNNLENERNKHISEISSSNDDLSRQTKIKISELETALVSKTEFLNNMSHEIRTPIQGFTALSEGLVTHWQSFSEEKRLDLASQVSNNAKRLASLVTNLLDFSKFTADKMIMDFQKISLSEVVYEIIEECKELYLGNKDIKFKFASCKNDSICADRNRIEQVLRNLFVNAIKFSANNSIIEAKIEPSTINNMDAIQFTISDTGPGIPENEIESIFDPFVQSSRTRSKGGTGLGLSICKKIIDAHNGKVWAENQKDSGAVFYFIIPISQEKEEIFVADHSLVKILMIDDEDICLSSMELLLTNTPYKLIKANSGSDAIKYLKNNYDSVDLILLDLMMPDIYGLNILESIKKDSKLKKIPVILQSGTSDKSEIQKAYSLGIFSYISKPYKRNIILAEISKAINYYTA